MKLLKLATRVNVSFHGPECFRVLSVIRRPDPDLTKSGSSFLPLVPVLFIRFSLIAIRLTESQSSFASLFTYICCVAYYNNRDPSEIDT
jgi:hypothetical protein